MPLTCTDSDCVTSSACVALLVLVARHRAADDDVELLRELALPVVSWTRRVVRRRIARRCDRPTTGEVLTSSAGAARPNAEEALAIGLASESGGVSGNGLNYVTLHSAIGQAQTLKS